MKKKPVSKTEYRSPQTLLFSLFAALLLIVFFFLFDQNGYLALLEAKWPAFLWICGGYAVLVPLLAAEQRLVSGPHSTGRSASLLKESSWTQRLLALYLLFTVLSAFFSGHPEAAWLGGARREGVLTIGIELFCFFAVARFGRARPWLVWLLGVVTGLQCLLCILQLSGGNPFGLYPDGLTYFDAGTAYSGAYLGTIGNVDFLGVYFSLAAPILWVSLLRLKNPWRWGLLLPLGLSLFVIWRMRVLSCLVGVGLGALIALPLVLPASKKARRGLALALGLCVLAGVLVLYFAPLPAGRLLSVQQLLHGNVDRAIDSGRLYIWREVLQRIPKHLLFGFGPDTMSLAGIPPFTRLDEATGQHLVAYIDAAHNEYLNILFHQGVFALLCEAGALLAALVRWARAARENAAAAILGAAVLSFAIQAFFNISMYITAPFFWLTLGLLDGALQKTERNEKDR